MSDNGELAQDPLSDAQFREWMSKRDFPEPGEDSITPALFVGSLPKKDDELHTTVIMIAGDAWTGQRHAIMHMLGARCCDEGMRPVAVALISEGWARAFTPEEGKARGKRQIADYEDREEWVMLSGATIDGRAALIRAPLLRNDRAVITGYGPRFISFDEKDGVMKVKPVLLQRFFLGYLGKEFIL